MDKFEFTNIYTREFDDETGLQVVFINKKQHKHALIYSLFELYYVSVLNVNFPSFEEFKADKGKSYSNTIIGCRNIDSPEDMLLIKLANQDFIQLKWVEDNQSGEANQDLRIITAEYKSIKRPDGITVYDWVQSLYNKGEDCLITDLRL
jgi:hypothetical protein